MEQLIFKEQHKRFLDLPAHVLPPSSDIPSPLLDSYVDQFATQPKVALQQVLDAKEKFANPREIGRILVHTPHGAPFAIAHIRIDSNDSSRALLFSFMSAIDLDCLSIVDAIRFITQHVAIPTSCEAIQIMSEMFAIAYGLRNQLEWPNKEAVADIFCVAVAVAADETVDFFKEASAIGSLKDVPEQILQDIGKELKEKPLAVFFTSIPMWKPDPGFNFRVEHEARYRAQWKEEMYQFSASENKIKCFGIGNRKQNSEIPLECVFATQKVGDKKRPWCFELRRNDGKEFGRKVKEEKKGTDKLVTVKESTKKQYVLASKDELEVMMWISAVNMPRFMEQVRALLKSLKGEE